MFLMKNSSKFSSGRWLGFLLLQMRKWCYFLLVTCARSNRAKTKLFFNHFLRCSCFLHFFTSVFLMYLYHEGFVSIILWCCKLIVYDDIRCSITITMTCVPFITTWFFPSSFKRSILMINHIFAHISTTFEFRDMILSLCNWANWILSLTPSFVLSIVI
jgi:hypothetical protein